MPTLDHNALAAFARGILLAAGVGDDEAGQVADSLVAADLSGHESHGVVRLPWYCQQLDDGELVAGAELETLHETAAAIVCDAQLGFGQVQMHRLLRRVCDKANQTAVACGTLRNSGHIGRLSEYTEAVATQGMAAMLWVNDNGVLRVVAPPGGTEPQVSTNPISIAVPTDTGPLVLDTSTSVVAQGKVLIHRLDNKPCPEGWLQDAEGNPTTDPTVLKADPPGSILPTGGEAAYKGFGLSLLLDALVGGLSGGCCPPPQPGATLCNTVLVVVWDPAQMAGREHFLTQASGLVSAVRGSRRKPGVDAIRLPGDRSRQVRSERVSAGIPVRDGTWQQLIQLASRLGVQAPKT
ncbi:MAG: Ldh family oxidoreductase [Planctomycetales bacterium]|nr:Ldh family oxidoreductase [Planctomycetales bacterium]